MYTISFPCCKLYEQTVFWLFRIKLTGFTAFLLLRRWLQMHGATYTVDAEFKTDALVEKSNWVVDIGAASEMLGAVLSKYNFKNLNEIFPGQNTTTEFMCKVGGCVETQKTQYHTPVV